MVVIGDSGVGKSSLMDRCAGRDFNTNSHPTIGLEFGRYSTKIGSREVIANIWDTPGLQQFRNIVASYYQGAVGVMLVYDISRRQSYEYIKDELLKELRGNARSDVVGMLVGNKGDLEGERTVMMDEAREFAGIFLA